MERAGGRPGSAHRRRTPGLVLRRGRRDLQSGVDRVIPNPHGGSIQHIDRAGGNDTRCTDCVNREASDTALPVSHRPNWLSQRRFGRRRGAHPRVSRGQNCCAAQKMRGSYSWRNLLRVRDLGKSRWVREGSAKKNGRCAEKENASTCAVCAADWEPAIEKGASRVSFGSHYSLDGERRGWACERHPH